TNASNGTLMVKSKSSVTQLEVYRMAMVYSSSSIRAFGSLLCRFSNGVYHKPRHSCSLKCVFLLTENFSSSSWHSSADIRLLPLELQSRNSMRKIWTFSPLCTGRSSCKIAGRESGILKSFLRKLWIRVEVFTTLEDVLRHTGLANYGRTSWHVEKFDPK
ncbi:hypothetical protein MTR67_035935, partial [Solanum verrucosum]